MNEYGASGHYSRKNWRLRIIVGIAVAVVCVLLAIFLIRLYHFPINRAEGIMILKAFAKLNWTLDITGVREDGYHLMDMVMQPVSLSDEITLTPEKDITITTSGFPPCPADESNLAINKTAGI